MAKVKIRLTHNCRKPGCEGDIDQVIDIDDKDWAFFEERGGAFKCDDKGNALKKKEEKAPAEK